MKLRQTALKDLQERYDISQCPYMHNRNGFAKHMSVKDHPQRFEALQHHQKYALRFPPGRRPVPPYGPEAERANSTIKEDIKILEKPRVIQGFRANILAQMAAIVLQLKRTFSFIVRVTGQFRKFRELNDPDIKEKLKPLSEA